MFCFVSCFHSDLCGAQGATQGIGFLLGLCSIPLTAGAPIAGFLYDQTKSYRMSFIMAGIPALVGAALMTPIRFMRDERIDTCNKPIDDQFNKLLNKPAWTEGLLSAIHFVFFFLSSSSFNSFELQTIIIYRLQILTRIIRRNIAALIHSKEKMKTKPNQHSSMIIKQVSIQILRY